jgi:SpoU rRNA methylase family enzyme
VPARKMVPSQLEFLLHDLVDWHNKLKKKIATLVDACPKRIMPVNTTVYGQNIPVVLMHYFRGLDKQEANARQQAHTIHNTRFCRPSTNLLVGIQPILCEAINVVSGEICFSYASKRNAIEKSSFLEKVFIMVMRCRLHRLYYTR